MDLSFIIVSYNAAAELSECINSITSVFGKPANIYIIENGIVNEPLQSYIEKLPNAEYTKSDFNVGFASANNKAVLSVDSEYVAFINPDTYIVEDFITPILDFMKKHKETGACAPMLVYPDMKYQNSSGFRMGFFHEFLEALMLLPLYRKFFYLKIKSNKSKIPVRVGWVSAACLLVRREVFEKVGGFSEEYFLNYEDIDLCRKLEDAGFKNYYFPGLKCIHLDHKSFNDNYKLLVTSRYKSLLIYSGKHYSVITRLVLRFFHIIGILIRLLLSLILFKGNERNQRISGYYESLLVYLGLSASA